MIPYWLIVERDAGGGWSIVTGYYSLEEAQLECGLIFDTDGFAVVLCCPDDTQDSVLKAFNSFSGMQP